MKKTIKPAVRHELVDYARASFGVSLRRACRVVGISDALYRYQPDWTKDEPVVAALAEWAEDNSIELEFIKPGKPTQNSYVEWFNRTYRDEVLNMYVFRILNEVREIAETWMRQYNEERPHD